MDPLTWTGSLSFLNPVTIGVAVAFAIAAVAQILLSFTASEPSIIANPDGTVVARGGAYGIAEKSVRWLFLALIVLVAIYIVGGAIMSYGSAGIVGGLAKRFLPVWAALILTFALSIRYKRRLGLYGKLFDSTIGMIGFGMVMFWVFTAIFADLVTTHDVLSQISRMKNKMPGTPTPDEMGWYLLGGDHLGRDVFSRVVMGSRIVVQIAPLATMFAFMVGITLGLPAGYYGGRLDTGLSFLANLILAFPVILLFYLLVTPEIVETGMPQYMAMVLFLFPIVFLLILVNSRFYVVPALRNKVMLIIAVVGGYLYLSLIGEVGTKVAVLPNALDLIHVPGNILIVFVSVVFVNSPTVFRIVRGIVLDIKTRDYVSAAQTRGERPWYIMLWEMLPNARGPLIVDFCLRIGYTTILLGTLGFFGLGLSPESPDWGSTINAGRKLMTVAQHPAIVPALALMSLVLGLNLLADGLREESMKD
ncbi:Glutathione transport system permease protein GsiD [Defluviimonas aquaemixtae]|uniref:Glutathione transport system permease protein GsiD n=1 Tax=Albidovulum aquaemixtae TaxID=1542388 RepID=A0A2R8B5R8_9RHOB|nr:ABC transporter permease [Defluviimonas aquaemixtae]SPH17988.1 Glutathione transport system permease protein GsiD [Defluviimonas aquaemixtae]